MYINTDKMRRSLDELVIVMDSDSLDELQSLAAKQKAEEETVKQGFQVGGFSRTPRCAAIDADTDDFVGPPKPNMQLAGFRGEYTFARKV